MRIAGLDGSADHIEGHGKQYRGYSEGAGELDPMHHDRLNVDCGQP